MSWWMWRECCSDAGDEFIPFWLMLVCDKRYDKLRSSGLGSGERTLVLTPEVSEGINIRGPALSELIKGQLILNSNTQTPFERNLLVNGMGD